MTTEDTTTPQRGVLAVKPDKEIREITGETTTQIYWFTIRQNDNFRWGHVAIPPVSALGRNYIYWIWRTVNPQMWDSDFSLLKENEIRDGRSIETYSSGGDFSNAGSPSPGATPATGVKRFYIYASKNSANLPTNGWDPDDNVIGLLDVDPAQGTQTWWRFGSGNMFMIGGNTDRLYFLTNGSLPIASTNYYKATDTLTHLE